jgi:CubicO group peptidase (beta-lactamase class C family)
MSRLQKFLSVVILFILISYEIIFAQVKTAKIDEFMSAMVEYQQFTGTMLVAEKGKVIYKKGFGLANMDWDIPNVPNTKFRIGSITKQFVAMQIMQLVDEGKIKLDGKLSDYLPEYRKDTGEKITIHHLLTHTSGIPPYTGLPGFWSDSSRNSYDIDYMVKHFHSGDLEFEPGTQYKYNNSGYFLLAVIIEKVTGKSYEDNLKERILQPVKMNNTGVDRNQRILEKRASGYYRHVNGYTNEPYFYMTNAMGAGDMYSTVEDLYLWDQALYTEKLLSKKLKEKMFTPYLDNYAYGWSVRNVSLDKSTDSVKTISHSGGINGFNTRIYRLVNNQHLVVVFNNTGGADLNGICEAVTDILYDRPYELPKRSITEVISKAIDENGVDSAIAQYRDLKVNHEDEYNFGEYELNRLGYQLLGMEKVDEAIKIFELNVEMFPEAFNPYDSLGEAYMIKGDKKLAIKNYAKSLELNPQNTNAIVMLSKINKSK